MAAHLDLRKEFELTLGLILVSVVFLYAGFYLVHTARHHAVVLPGSFVRSVSLDNPVPMEVSVARPEIPAPIIRVPRPVEPAAEPLVPIRFSRKLAPSLSEISVESLRAPPFPIQPESPVKPWSVTDGEVIAGVFRFR